MNVDDGRMTIAEAQREVRVHFVGGFYGQLVSGILWLTGAALATWSGPRAAITTMVLGGFFIFPVTELLLRLSGGTPPLSADNGLRQLGMQVAFVLPLSMLLLIPVGLLKLNWFFPALMILLGAHYLPFAFMYGMRIFMALGYLLVCAGVLLAMYGDTSFSAGAWFTGVVLLVFAFIARAVVTREGRS